MTREDLLTELTLERYGRPVAEYRNPPSGVQQIWELFECGGDEQPPLQLVWHERRSA